MANVYFKRGHQAALDAMSSYVEGSFYLTDDTNRLYFAQASNKLVDLNQYIHFVSTRSNLPTVAGATLKDGDIYYIQSENILCIYQANENPPWVQINPDTALKTGQNAIIAVDNIANSEDASISLSFQDTKNTTVQGSFDLVGGANVTITTSGNTITIDAENDTSDTQYQLQTPTQNDRGRINLHNTSSTSASDSYIDIVGDGTVSVVSDATTRQITISGASAVTSISDGFDNNGEYQIELGGVNLHTAGVTPTITYGVAQGSQADAVFANGTATLNVYTATEVDSLIAAEKAQLNAMKYAGLVHQDDASTLIVSAPVYGVGTVYKAYEDISVDSPSVTAKTGDLIIAGGTNDTAVVWEVVPAGDDQFISISGNASNNLVSFNDSANNTTTSLGTIGVEGGRKNNAATNAEIEVSTAVSGTGNKDTVFTIVHGAPGSGTAVSVPAASGAAIQTTGTALSIPVITGITKDAQGHITNVTAQTYTLTDTHATLSGLTTVVDASNNVASVSSTVGIDSQTETGGFDIASSTLTITASNSDTVNINLEWGTF